MYVIARGNGGCLDDSIAVTPAISCCCTAKVFNKRHRHVISGH